MTGWVVTGVGVVAAAILGCFGARRVALLVAALLPPRSRTGGAAELPSVVIVVPAHNEDSTIDDTLGAVARLDYPPARLFVVLVNDGSEDGTGRRLAEWAAGRPRSLAVDLPRRAGKAQALNAGILAAPASELVVVCDADLQPRPDFVRRLGETFSDDSVGAAAGYLLPVNARTSPIARYAAVESWVHQLVTSAAKDRLDLNPPTHGASAYRREALEQLGRFSSGPGEDIRMTVALTRAGWRTRFVPEAVAENRVVEGWADYWRQHVRWARNLTAAARAPQKFPAEGVGLARRLETRMVSLGYADRLALVAVIVLAGLGRLPAWVPVAYVGVILVQVGVALARAGVAGQMPFFLFWTVGLFALDVAASAAATAAHVGRRPRTWQRLSRSDVARASAEDEPLSALE